MILLEGCGQFELQYQLNACIPGPFQQSSHIIGTEARRKWWWPQDGRIIEHSVATRKSDVLATRYLLGDDGFMNGTTYEEVQAEYYFILKSALH